MRTQIPTVDVVRFDIPIIGTGPIRGTVRADIPTMGVIRPDGPVMGTIAGAIPVVGV